MAPLLACLTKPQALRSTEYNMTDNEFFTLAEATLSSIESAVDASGADIDIERSGNVLTLEFANHSKIIINLQAAMHEIWIAAKAGGFHYQYQDDAWCDTRDKTELFTALARYASEQAQEKIEFPA